MTPGSQNVPASLTPYQAIMKTNGVEKHVVNSRKGTLGRLPQRAKILVPQSRGASQCNSGLGHASTNGPGKEKHLDKPEDLMAEEHVVNTTGLLHKSKNVSKTDVH